MRRRPPAPGAADGGGAPWYRRSPTVVSYWRGRQLVFHNYRSSVQVTGPPVVAEVLHYFDRWRRADRLADAVPSAAHLVDRLADQTTAGAMGGPRDAPAARPRRRLAALGTGRGVVPLLDQGPFRHHPGSRGDRAARRRQAYQRRTGRRRPCACAAGAEIALERPTPPNALEAVLRPAPHVARVRRRAARESRRRAPLVVGLGRPPMAGRPARRDMRCGRRRRRAHDRSWKCTWWPSESAGLEPGLYHYAIDRHSAHAPPRPRLRPHAAAVPAAPVVVPRRRGVVGDERRVSAHAGTVPRPAALSFRPARSRSLLPDLLPLRHGPRPRTVLHAGARRSGRRSGAGHGRDRGVRRLCRGPRPQASWRAMAAVAGPRARSSLSTARARTPGRPAKPSRGD